MAFCKNHHSLYFDNQRRNQKAEAVLCLIHATYQAKIHKGNKNDIARMLKNAYELFRFDAGSYTGDNDQFSSQYTIGHELGIWTDSDLNLCPLATRVAKNEITVKDYFDIVMLNYIQPIDNKITHLLYETLKYANQKQINKITKSDLNDIFSWASQSDKNNINGLFNMFIGTSYFSKLDDNTLEIKYPVESILSCCNIECLDCDLDELNSRFSVLKDYVHYLTKDHRSLNLIKEMASKEIGEQQKNDDVVDEWIIPVNPKQYNHREAFRKYGILEKEQNASYQVGDIVYVYSTLPDQIITCVTKVEKINIKSTEREVDDTEFIVGDKKEDKDVYVRLKLISECECPELSLDVLLKHGLLYAPQGPNRVKGELRDYIHSVINSKKDNLVGINKIYYGIPGCGKSYYIENTVLKDVDKDNDVFRTTFYLDYSNSDFIGQIYPVVKDRNVTYEPKPGPFTKALERALRNPGRMIYLVIEEINRGNAAAIFGDTFQLLDRLKENRDDRVVGDSEYPVANEFIEGYFEKVNETLEEDEKIKFTKNKIFIPHNLTLLATMNTSDQNVFPLDTAFKRRWDREKVMTDWNKVGDIKNLYVPFTDITWGKFATTINKKMLVDDGESDVSVSEDKQMGAYFVKENMLSQKKNTGDKDSLRAFISNVMDYLYNDVTKFNHGLLFDNSVKTYDGLYETMTECTSVLNGNVDDSTVGAGKRLFESVLNKEIVDELFDQDVEDEQGTKD